MRKKHFHIWRLMFVCFILATIGFFCVQGNLLIDFCSKIFVNADVLPEASYSKVLGEPQELVILGVTATSKQYDGEKDVEVTVNFSGVATGDDATVVCKGNVLNADAGNQKYVELSNFQIMGEDSANYSLPQDINISPVFVDILPRDTELVWQVNDNYTYNGSNQISTISAFYRDIQNKKVPVEFSIKGYSLQDNNIFANEFKNAGNYTAKALLTLQDSNYNPQDSDGNTEKSLRINRARPVIQISTDRTFVYNGLLQDASKCATINNNEQTLTFTNNTFTTVTEGLNINQKGGVVVSAPQTANYLEETTTYTIDVVKASSQIDISNVKIDYVYSGLTQTVDGATLNNTEQTLQYSNNTFTSVADALKINEDGGVFIYAPATENFKYTSKYVYINVEKKALDVSKMSLKWSATSFVFDGKMKEVKISNFNDAILDVSYKNERNTDAGEYLATAVFTLKDSDNYKLTSNTLNKEWNIAKREITKPTVQDHTTTYNSNLQALPLTNGTYYSAVNHIQTNAGVYTVAFSLNDKNNTVWKDDKSTQDLTFNWTILKAQVETPTYSSIVVYDGKNHCLQIAENSLYTILQTSQSAVGDYQTFLVLNDDRNYEWKDNPITPYLSLNWKIVENENYNNNTPTIAIAFMLSAVILLALYATLHFTSVRRRKKKVSTALNKKTGDEVLNTTVNKPEVQQEKQAEQNKAEDKVKSSNKLEKLSVVEDNFEAEQDKLEKKTEASFNKPVGNVKDANISSKTEQIKTAEQKQKTEDSAEKTRKKRMLSRKKADKKKRKKVVVDDTPKKRGRPKKVEGQPVRRKKTSSKAKSSKVKK